MDEQRPWERIAELEQELSAGGSEALDWLRAGLGSDSGYFAPDSGYAVWCESDEGQVFLSQLEESVAQQRERQAESLAVQVVEQGPRGRLSGLAERRSHCPAETTRVGSGS